MGIGIVDVGSVPYIVSSYKSLHLVNGSDIDDIDKSLLEFRDVNHLHHCYYNGVEVSYIIYSECTIYSDGDKTCIDKRVDYPNWE